MIWSNRGLLTWGICFIVSADVGFVQSYRCTLIEVLIMHIVSHTLILWVIWDCSASGLIVCPYWCCRKCKMSCWQYMKTSCLRKKILEFVHCWKMKGYFYSYRFFCLHNFCSVWFKWKNPAILFLNMGRWRIFPECIGFIVKFRTGWNL